MIKPVIFDFDGTLAKPGVFYLRTLNVFKAVLI